MSRADLRTQIRPFPNVSTYLTGWAGQLTFEQIYDDLIPSFNRLLRYYRNAELDIPDLIAHAFIRSWTDISANTNLLSTVDKGGALKLLLNRTNPQLYRKFYRHEMYLEDIATRSGDPDEFIIDGYAYSHIIGYATYAELSDLVLRFKSQDSKTLHACRKEMKHLVEQDEDNGCLKSCDFLCYYLNLYTNFLSLLEIICLDIKLERIITNVSYG